MPTPEREDETGTRCEACVWKEGELVERCYECRKGVKREKPRYVRMRVRKGAA